MGSLKWVAALPSAKPRIHGRAPPDKEGRGEEGDTRRREGEQGNWRSPLSPFWQGKEMDGAEKVA